MRARRQGQGQRRWAGAVVVLGLVASLTAAAVVGAPSPAGADAPTRLLATGGFHTCATTLGDGSVRCWGYDNWGQTDVPPGLGAPKALAVGAYHSCAIGPDDAASCWGDEPWGATSVPGDLGPVKAIAAGRFATCAITSSDAVRCWGSSGFSPEGTPPSDLGPAVAVSVGTTHSCAVRPDGTVRCWGYDDVGQSSPPSGLAGVTAIDTGTDLSCAIDGTATVRCWGTTAAEVTTVPSDASPATDVAAGTASACAVRTDGTLRCWGDDRFGQTDAPAGTFRAVTGSAQQYCAIRTDETIACWPSTADSGEAPAAPAPAPATAIVGAPYEHTFESARGTPRGDFAVTSGTLPAGLALSPDGVLSGTPTAIGTSTFTVGVDGGVFAAASASFTLEVRELAPPVSGGDARVGGIVDRPRVTKLLTAIEGTWVPAATSYRYQWSRGSGEDFTDIPGATARTYRPVAADLDQLLRVEITGVNDDGESSTTATTARTVAQPPGTTAAPQVPAEVTDLTARGAGTDRRMDVSWTPAFKNGSDLTKVWIEVDPDGAGSPTTIELPGNAKRHSVVCAGDAGCDITVRAQNAVGLGPAATVSGAFRAPEAPSANALRLDTAIDRSYLGAFTAPRDMGGRQVTRYEYDVSVDGGPFSEPIPLTAAQADPSVPGGTKLGAQLPCPGASIGCVYRYYATNPIGRSEPSAPTAQRPFDPPDKPKVALEASTTPGTVTAVLTPPVRTNGLPLTGYEISAVVDGAGVPTAPITVPSGTTRTLVECPDVTASCTVIVAATTLLGPGLPASKTMTFTGGGHAVPREYDLTVTGVDLAAPGSTVAVSWRYPADLGNSDRKAMRFELSVCGEECAEFVPTTMALPADRREAVVQCLAPAETCRVRVRSWTPRGGYSRWSTGHDTIVPHAPTVSATDRGSGVNRVEWQARGSSLDIDAITGWRVFACDVESGCGRTDYAPVASLPASATSTDHSCGEGIVCQYVVYAIRSGGVPGHVSAPVIAGLPT